MRRLSLCLAAAGLLAGAATFQAQGQVSGYVPPNDQANCTDWTRKLEAGIEVIGAKPNRVAEAQKQLEAAKRQQAAGKFFECATAASNGLRALDAG